MNDNLTEIIFILDRSGSMESFADDTIGGFNQFVKDQQEKPGDVILTTILFDNKYEVLHDRLDIKQVQPMTRQEYTVRGSTALYDAVGKALRDVRFQQKKMPKATRPGKTIVVITTDGLENSSKVFDRSQIMSLIKYRQEKNGWELVFLGANMDAPAYAESIGIKHAATYSASNIGTQSVYSTTSEMLSAYRKSGSVDDDIITRGIK